MLIAWRLGNAYAFLFLVFVGLRFVVPVPLVWLSFACLYVALLSFPAPPALLEEPVPALLDEAPSEPVPSLEASRKTDGSRKEPREVFTSNMRRV